MMCGCNKCMMMGTILLLIIGVLFLLVDLGVWNFWGIQWWTALFLFMGLGHLGHACCKDCKVKLKK
ncbi:MAG: hypothetical protein KKG59_07620 [Nanoarchaeota archaeon]|nr:hypothetical protein [Nanoarchaeota archaeon]